MNKLFYVDIGNERLFVRVSLTTVVLETYPLLKLYFLIVYIIRKKKNIWITESKLLHEAKRK